MVKRIAVIVGSLRKESWNRKVALTLMKLAPDSLDMDIVEIADLPLYNQDLDDENRPPQEWTDFREKMKQYDGVLFACPEYNRSIPSPLKNAIDVGSRPYGQSIWNKKPVAVFSASPGSMGGFGANHHLRQTFVFLDMPCMQQPECYLNQVDQLFDEKSNIKSKNTEEFLRKFIDNYAKWVEQLNK